ncbi:MAG: peptide/nickel transport system substrate-binding protein [Candidatus Latescibacterota bacterium]|jgi:peptide/nickel transport system substrate-binding protein
MKHGLLYTVCATLCALFLISCGGGQETGGGQQSGGEVTSLEQIARNRTLILDCVDAGICAGQMKDYDTFNPYIPGRTARTGYQFLYEPLYFYNAYGKSDNVIPWIATGHEFNGDFTEITVHIRDGVKWSDGQPWTAQDFVFTINMLKDNAPVLLWSTDMQTWVKEAVAVDDLTAKITLTAANPRFMFTYFTHNFDNGVPIIPKHIWEGKNPEEFANFDMAKGWPVISGPYKMVLSSTEQRVWDRRDDWWASTIGFRALPKVERLIFLPYVEEAKRVQLLLANTLDTCVDSRPPNIRAMVDGNPNLTTWTGRESPYGYLDWWPISLGFNNQEPPFTEVSVRRAISYAIDRDQLVEIAWQGSGSTAKLPFPEFPPLRRFTDGISDLLEQHDAGVYSLEKSAAMMRDNGWKKNGDGMWEKDGETVRMAINIFGAFNDVGQVIVAQLKKAGFDASFRMLSDVYDQMSQGEARAFLNGHAGSVRDPYFTLRLYHSRFVKPTGEPAEHFWRWSNTEFDAIVDEMGRTAADDPKLHGLFREAMAIWLAEMPSVPILQWYHRIPHNETYWTNWPSAENPYINSAYWHRTWLLVLLGLEPTQG